MNTQLMTQGLEVAAFGLGGVFTVLILFYIATKIMLLTSKRINANTKKQLDNN